MFLSPSGSCVRRAGACVGQRERKLKANNLQTGRYLSFMRECIHGEHTTFAKECWRNLQGNSSHGWHSWITAFAVDLNSVRTLSFFASVRHLCKVMVDLFLKWSSFTLVSHRPIDLFTSLRSKETDSWQSERSCQCSSEVSRTHLAQLDCGMTRHP